MQQLYDVCVAPPFILPGISQDQLQHYSLSASVRSEIFVGDAPSPYRIPLDMTVFPNISPPDNLIIARNKIEVNLFWKLAGNDET